MFFNTSSLPYSLFNLMIDNSLVVDEGYSYRPDQLVSDKYNEDLILEVFCNEVNNFSPISLSPTSEYLMPSRLFMKHFFRV